jgi:hypothetical protein
MGVRVPSTRSVVLICAAVVAVGLAVVVGVTLWARTSDPGTASATAGPTAVVSGPSTPEAVTPAATPSAASELEPSRTREPQPPPSSTATPAGPSLTGPLPASASARGSTLVAGFPTSVVPVLDGLEVVSSSVASDGTHLQVGLEAASATSPQDVTAQYVAALGSAGFSSGPAAATAGSSATAFVRGPDGLVLTVTPRVGGGTEMSIAGTLTTSG